MRWSGPKAMPSPQTNLFGTPHLGSTSA